MTVVEKFAKMFNCLQISKLIYCGNLLNMLLKDRVCQQTWEIMYFCLKETESFNSWPTLWIVSTVLSTQVLTALGTVKQSWCVA